ncbi:pyruvate, phosphate dikinase [Candidatus Desantisbacteria bacterium CG2_30_40_21]|uniref:Pyruvate, phosphate dikinase n=3 Tax=unclassified Candidatus Desantisiibacteriota TaxID=3106372 RepID=A0A2M7JCI0_9BACT|nr:MAG: pyruvate, phosphate dikinase [Candidatus Desantisbacteria bacterium CG2_30_40_21]PIX17063.1 MAG: pyruvate, phosphate dikinase [Candidatus Desantisbacteria bacterium CG_4_8_14_3_um_filter_40_12]PJB28090.1 MAG: pyruvate, phosphate dikinase [Candidatus Desantisbacteria bacterium CG_4_9_14_3_um_filter_40_11]
MNKLVYFFGGGKAEGTGTMKDSLGGKGAGLAEMTNIGIPVPPGFTITTEGCVYYYKNNKQYPEGLQAQIDENLNKLEELMGKKLGNHQDPFLVSVRSGAKISMPGMMDTVLNLGLNNETVKGLAIKTHNERFAYDAYRRFIQMFSNVVLGVKHDDFEFVLNEVKQEEDVTLDNELSTEALRNIVARYLRMLREVEQIDFPQDPRQQLKMAIDAVFESWDSPRAVTYRRLYDIPDSLGTAVNIQSMVFGNMGEDCATGVAFTRDPSTGEKVFYGEYLTNAQGEDVVAGIRTPRPIVNLNDEMPEAYGQLTDIYKTLENHYKDMQDIEFTIENQKLYMLQTRTGKRTAAAAIKIAVEMVDEGLISKEQALLRVDPSQLDQLLHPHIDPKAKIEVIATGLNASPGAISGAVVFSADDACNWVEQGKKVLLVRKETSPDDIHGMAVAVGILTARGGMTSHAAVVARGMGKSCVAGCETIKVDEENKRFTVGDHIVSEGDIITIDGSSGRVILGKAPTIEAEMTLECVKLLGWADEIRRLKIRTNADDPAASKKAREFGAEGIGLCRTEHMFFAEDRLPIMQEMILAENEEERRKALAKLLPMQQGDFYEMFKAMEGLPVTIRLLDPPLHEFLPKYEELLVEITRLEITGENKEELTEKKKLFHKVENLRELNPMLGLRGCRLGISFPEITEMQARAIIQAACDLTKEGIQVFPEIMVPLVSTVAEFKVQKELIQKTAEEVFKEKNTQVEYLIGTMIELPRAALVADKIAQEAQFFSFGTNDLTQTTFGFSRDDAEGKFLDRYVETGIVEKNPFEVLDREGVGELVKIGTQKGRSVKPNLKVGVCGEHGGNPSSIEFCHMIGLSYVSCSPYRVPIARLAAAQAVLRT